MDPNKNSPNNGNNNKKKNNNKKIKAMNLMVQMIRKWIIPALEKFLKD